MEIEGFLVQHRLINWAEHPAICPVLGLVYRIGLQTHSFVLFFNNESLIQEEKIIKTSHLTLHFLKTQKRPQKLFQEKSD